MRTHGLLEKYGQVEPRCQPYISPAYRKTLADVYKVDSDTSRKTGKNWTHTGGRSEQAIGAHGFTGFGRAQIHAYDQLSRHL